MRLRSIRAAGINSFSYVSFSVYDLSLTHCVIQVYIKNLDIINEFL